MWLPRFDITSDQIRKAADICANIGQVCFAVIVVPSFLELVDPVIAIAGAIATCAAWVGSLYLVKQAKYFDYDH